MPFGWGGFDAILSEDGEDMDMESPMPFGWGGFDAEIVSISNEGRKRVSNAFRLGGL